MKHETAGQVQILTVNSSYRRLTFELCQDETDGAAVPIESKEKAKVVRKKVACKEKGLLKMIVHTFPGCLPRVRTPLCGQCDEKASRETQEGGGKP